MTRLPAFARRAAGMRPDEAAVVGWSSALSFCVLSGWYLLRPLRDAMALVGTTRDLPHLFLATLAGTLLASAGLSALASRLPRRQFVPTVYRALGLTLLAFAVLLRDKVPPVSAARAFFVWSSVLNLVAVALSWGFRADVFSPQGGARLFGLIGAGGTLGAIVGSATAAALAEHAGPVGMLLLAALLLEASARLVRKVSVAAASLVEAGPDASEVERPLSRGGAIGWFWSALRRPLVVALAVHIGLFTLTSTALYLEQARIVQGSLVGTGARAALFARMDLAVNAIAFVLQLVVVGRLVRGIGLGAALAVLPVVTLGAFVAVRAEPVLQVLVAVQVVRRAVDFALAKPAREVLFTLSSREDRYKAKGFLDTFVYRSGDAVAAWGLDGLGGKMLSVVVVGACVAWGGVAFFLGRFGRR